MAQQLYDETLSKVCNSEHKHFIDSYLFGHVPFSLKFPFIIIKFGVWDVSFTEWLFIDFKKLLFLKIGLAFYFREVRWEFWWNGCMTISFWSGRIGWKVQLAEIHSKNNSSKDFCVRYRLVKMHSWYRFIKNMWPFERFEMSPRNDVLSLVGQVRIGILILSFYSYSSPKSTDFPWNDIRLVGQVRIGMLIMSCHSFPNLEKVS